MINQITGSRHRNQQLQQPPNICNLTTPFQHPIAPNSLSSDNPQDHKTNQNNTGPFQIASVNFGNSQAELTLKRYTYGNPEEYPIDVFTGYVNQYKRSFPGCLACGDLNHLFKDCSNREDSRHKARFFRELNAKIPRKRVDETTGLIKINRGEQFINPDAVSYTHLTLPTIVRG